MRDLALKDWLVIIPARLKSERLPEKPLQDLGGRALIVRVHENLAPLAKEGATLVVATDSERVAQCCAPFGIKAVMTSVTHQSGTDRCAEVTAKYEHPFVLNVQGDEPDVDVADLLRLMNDLSRHASADLGTLAVKGKDPKNALNPNIVKVILAADGRALYFSRAGIPYCRDSQDHAPSSYWHHLGVYAFRRARLLEFVKLGPSRLELEEKLEQLRALEHGWHIHVTEANRFCRGIDTLSDLEAHRARYA